MSFSGTFVAQAGSANPTTTGTTIPIVTAAAIPVGHLALLVMMCSSAATLSSVADGTGNVWSVASPQGANASAGDIAIAYSPVGTQIPNAGTVTPTLSGSIGGRAALLFDLSGWDASSPLDASVGAAGTIAASQTSVTLAAAGAASVRNEIEIAVLETNGATTAWAATGFQAAGNINSQGTIHSLAVFYRIITDIETASAAFSWTTAATGTTLLHAFKNTSYAASSAVILGSG